MIVLCLVSSLLCQSLWHHPCILTAHATLKSSAQQAQRTQAVTLAYRKVGGIPVRYVIADLNNPQVRVGVVTARYLGVTESVWGMLARARPTAAITGTYFSTTNKLPVGDIVVEGELVHFGGVGTALCITYDNQARFVRQRLHRRHDWSMYRVVLGAGPRLLLNGRVWLYPSSEGFRDKRVYARSKRTAVGVTKQNKLLMVVVERPITLRRLAYIMKALGATDAIALDGGGSTFLYYRNRVKVFPQRRLTNLLVVYESGVQYEARRPYLTPRARYALR